MTHAAHHSATPSPHRSVRFDATGQGHSDQYIDVVPWMDPLVDGIGFPTDDAYVEMFWLPVLGPTATWLVRRLAAGLHRDPEGYRTDLADLARSLGVSHGPGRHGPFARALHRCSMFGVTQQVALSPVPVVAVRRSLPPVARRHLDRLPEPLRHLHDSWPVNRA